MIPEYLRQMVKFLIVSFFTFSSSPLVSTSDDTFSETEFDRCLFWRFRLPQLLVLKWSTGKGLDLIGTGLFKSIAQNQECPPYKFTDDNLVRELV